LKYRHLDERINRSYDAARLFKSLVNFGPVTLEITLSYLCMVKGRKSAYRSSFVALALPKTIGILMGALKAAMILDI